METLRKSKELRRSLMTVLIISTALMIGMINFESRKIETAAAGGPLITAIAVNILGSNLKNAVTTKSMNGMVSWIDEQYYNLSEQTSKTFFEKFGPDIETFFTMTGTDWNTYDIFRVAGVIIAILITIFMFWMIAMGTIKLADVKDTPLQLIGSLFVSIAIIFLSKQFAELFFEITQILWERMGATKLEGVRAWEVILFVIYPAALTGLFWGTTTVENPQDAVMAAANTMLGHNIRPIILVFNLILGIIFAKEVINFMVEIVERYIVACLLAVFMPIAAGTIPSKTTRSIFGKYIQMFASQLFLLLMNALFMMGIIFMCVDGGLTKEDSTITGWIFMFAYLRAAQRVDRYMFTMGLSVAVTGGNVFDTVGSSLRQLGGLIRGGQTGMDAAGGALVRAGVSGVNPGMAQIGRRIKDISHPLKTLSSGETVAGGTAGLLQAAKKLGNTPETISKLSPEMMDASMAKMAFAGGNDAKALSAMAPGTKQALLDNMYGPGTPKLKNISFNMDGTQSGIYTDEHGNKAAVTIGGDKGNVVGSLAAQTPDLKGEIFDIHSNGIGKAGEIIDVAGAEDFERASILSGVNIDGIADEELKANLDHMVVNSDGSIGMFDSDNELMARSSRDGLIYDNGNAFDNTDGELEKLPVFNGMKDIRMNLEPGLADNMSDAIPHLYAKDSDGDIHEFAAYNMAFYDDTYKPLKGKYTGVIGGINDASSGYYKVYEVTPEKVLSRDVGTGIDNTMTDQEKQNRDWNDRNQSKIDAYNYMLDNYNDHSSKRLNTRKKPTLHQH